MNDMSNDQVYIRALEISDLDRVLLWHNDPTLYQFLGGSFRWVSRVAEEDWLRRRCTYSATEINLAICLSGNDLHMGNIYLRNIDWVARHAELHIFIGDVAHRGKGFGKAAMSHVLCHAFGDLGLQRVYLFVLASNTPARQLYEKCGFREEGRMRHHAFKQGFAEDMLILGLLSSEWSKPESR